MSHYERNDGRFPDDSKVLVKYPLNPAQCAEKRSGWPWVPGCVAGQSGPDEWDIVVTGAAPFGHGEQGEPWFPMVYRDTSEIREVPGS